MVTTELGACEWFVWDLRRSNLIDRGQLDQIVGEFLQKNPRAEPQDLGEYLVAQEILTQFQAERLLQGKTQGFVLGPFTLMDALGSGSMGTVYKAANKIDSQWYAVKVLPRRSMWNVRIARRKVRAFEECRHASVIPFVDVGTAGGMHYLAWPYAEGEILEKVVKRDGQLPPASVAHIGMQIAEGLEVCHLRSLFHGLLKPSNLMIGAAGEVYILDFGIGCLLAETEGESLVDTMSTANSVTSGLDCSSPESIMDPTNLTPAGDQYSLGCIMYYMLAGQYPFPEGSAAEKMMAHQFKQPQSLLELAPKTPPELVRVIERLMQKKPENRFGSTGEVVEELRPFVPKTGEAVQPGAAKPKAPVQRTVSAPPKPESKTAPAIPARPKTMLSVQRPQTMGSLPSRNSLRGTGALATSLSFPAMPQSKPVDVTPADQTAAIVPGGADTMEEDRGNWEDRIGPTGVLITTIIACGLGFLAFKMFM